MTTISDNYSLYYADKLWNLLPAVYRAEDTDQFGANGPLRELVNRIGAQFADVRRNIDRMWEDQSIESCDDWAIPYIGALLGTNLVSGLDARGQRIDVAKTIYFRRRKGTLAVLEEIAYAITGWDAKAVEFFRRMARTRHGLDPAIGASYFASGAAGQLQIAEGLSGAITRTGIGGFADLRNPYGASKVGTAFDEFFHTADTRAPLGNSGWYNIPRLGVFLWRLASYQVGPVTPVAVAGCPDWYCFDPTGRDIPLFATARGARDFGDNWASPAEAELPTPISQTLLDTNEATTTAAKATNLYPDVLSVAFAEPDPASELPIPPGLLRLRPTRGRFCYLASPPASAEFVVAYHYGFPSDIGAGPYDRRGTALAVATPAPAATVSGGGTRLAAAGAVPGTGTLTIGDMLTYQGAADIALVNGALTLQAQNQMRPLIRLGAAAWRITGDAGASLTVDGLFVSGNDLVLSGAFDSVTISCCTLDPGSAAADAGGVGGSPPGPVFALAADGRSLVPTRLWIEATIGTLTIDRSVLGGVRTRNGGLVDTVAITNSIVQAICTRGDGSIAAAEIKDPERLETRLVEAARQGSVDLVANRLLALEPGIAALGAAGSPPHLSSPPSPAVSSPFLDLLNLIVMSPALYDPAAFAGVPLSAATRALLGTGSPPSWSPALNRALLDDAFPLELGDVALGFGDGLVNLSRCTVLGPVVVHRLEASECILWDLSQCDDAQGGCVRFSAWAEGSVLPRKYESVRIHQRAPLFTATDFGQPGYGQLTPLVGDAILPETTATAAPPKPIATGAVDGSEMGAYARDKNPIKERGLLQKYQEYMPAGLMPVIIHVT